MKSNLDKYFKVDDKHAEDGVDFVVKEADKDGPKIAFRVRHFNMSNPRIKAARAVHFKPYARQIELNTLSDEKQLEITINVFNDVCLVSWEGVEIDGKPAEFNKANAKALFTANPALFDALWRHANDFQNYKEDLGNS